MPWRQGVVGELLHLRNVAKRSLPRQFNLLGLGVLLAPEHTNLVILDHDALNLSRVRKDSSNGCPNAVGSGRHQVTFQHRADVVRSIRHRGPTPVLSGLGSTW